MISIIREYIKFISKSSNQHGVHSPFVYHFVTNCLYKKRNNEFQKLFLNCKNQLLNNKKTITVKEFGIGSTFFKTNKRSIARIAKIAGITNKKASILTGIIHYFKPLNILELGTSLGLSTSSIKIGNKKSKIITLEGCLETSKIAQQLFDHQNFDGVDIVIGDFAKTLPLAVKNNLFDFIYFDGNHTKKDTLEYFDYCLTTLTNESIWIFDDIYWSKEMKETWSLIKKHPKVTVTVDLFYFGIVFFRKEQAKEHFKIRV